MAVDVGVTQIVDATLGCHAAIPQIAGAADQHGLGAALVVDGWVV